MIQFSIIDKVDLFKQKSEVICSDLIHTSVSKDKLQRDFRKLENKLKIEQAKKKALQIKKVELEKKIMEINKEVGNIIVNTLIEEKDIEIQNLKKKLKMPHEAHVQTAKLKIVPQEKEILENELQNTKAKVGAFMDQKEKLEGQIKLLKDKVDRLSSSDPNFSLASKLGNLSVKEV